MQIIRLPAYVRQMGYTLEFDGNTYTARNSDAELIGTFHNEAEAIAFVEDASAAEAAELDQMDDPDCNWLMDIIDPARLLG